MFKDEERDRLEAPVAKLEVFEGAITTSAETLAEYMGVLANEGVSAEDIEWLGRVSDVAERIMGPLEILFRKINEVPTEVTVDEAEGINGEADGTENSDGLQLDHTTTMGFKMSERESMIWDLIIKNGSITEWFSQRDLGLATIGFSSDSARNQAFSQFCKKAVAAGLLVNNGKERGAKRYLIAPSLSVQQLESSGDISPEPEVQEAFAINADSQLDDLVSTPTKEQTPPLKAEANAETGTEAEADTRLEVTIRGQSVYFTPIEHKIVTALLEGPKSIREIIAYLNGGQSWADSEFFNGQVTPAMDHLKRLEVGETTLVQPYFVDGDGQRYIRFKLPDGARREVKKGGQEILRLTDSSTYVGQPGSRAKRQHEGIEGAKPTGDKPDHIVPRPDISVVPKVETGKLPATATMACLSETGISDSSTGEDIPLEPQTRAILNTLRSGDRLTIGSISKAINPDANGDATFNSIVADELSRLQSLLGSTTLKRKQKSGQPARWWLQKG